MAAAKQPATKAPARAAAPAPKPAAKAPAKAPAPAPAKAAPKPAAAPARPAAKATPAPAKAPARAAAAAPAAPAAAAGSNGSNPAIAKALKAMKARWNTAKEESKKGGAMGGTTAGVGKHECRLVDARMITEPNLAVIFEFTVVSGDDTGEKCIRWDGLDTDERIIFFQRDLRRLGVPVDDFDMEQVPQILDELKELQPLVRISVKEGNGDYKNTYIDKLLEETEGGAGDGVVEEAPPDPDGGEVAAEEAPVEEATEEVPAEEAAGDDVVNIGDPVAFTDGNGTRWEGTVAQFYTDDTVDVTLEGVDEPFNVAIGDIEKLIPA